MDWILIKFWSYPHKAIKWSLKLVLSSIALSKIACLKWHSNIDSYEASQFLIQLFLALPEFSFQIELLPVDYNVLRYYALSAGF